MDEKYTPYNHKGTKIDGVEPKHRGTPATKKRIIRIRKIISHKKKNSHKIKKKPIKSYKMICMGAFHLLSLVYISI